MIDAKLLAAVERVFVETQALAVPPLLLRNCRIEQQGRLAECEILILDGLIAAIGRDLVALSSTVSAIDLEGRIVLPGLIDCHVHFREPGESYKGGWLSESRAALAGGVTSVLDMPNNKPSITTNAALRNKRRIVNEKSLVDFGLYIGLSEGNVAEIEEATNIAGIKAYLNETTGSMWVRDDNVLLGALRLNQRVVVHAEEEQLERTIRLSKSVGRESIYVAHVSSASEVAMLKRESQLRVYAEVAPHHLLLTSRDKELKHGMADMKPPLKTEHDCSALWDAIREGLIDTIATDHAPHTVQEKAAYPWPMGIPSIELMLPLMLNEVNNGAITLGQLIKLTSRNPAKIFGIQGKGDLMIGTSADLVVVELDTVKQVDNSCIVTEHGWSPYLGRRLRGWPIMTLLRGWVAWPMVGKWRRAGSELAFLPHS